MGKSNLQRQAEFQERQRQEREQRKFHRRVLDQWKEHNVLHVVRQSDGGFRVGIESDAEGEIITAKLAELCSMTPDVFLEWAVGGAMADLGYAKGKGEQK